MPSLLAPEAPKSTSKEWQEASNERALAQKANPITGALPFSFRLAIHILTIICFYRYQLRRIQGSRIRFEVEKSFILPFATQSHAYAQDNSLDRVHYPIISPTPICLVSSVLCLLFVLILVNGNTSLSGTVRRDPVALDPGPLFVQISVRELASCSRFIVRACQILPDVCLGYLLGLYVPAAPTVVSIACMFN